MLANKYRPRKFEDVVGQSVATVTLQNQLNNGTVRNSYLFIGSAGTGKTTVARIFAHELNAEVIEIDAASNSGVDNVRNIKDNALLLSIGNDYKVFIIDECHALSNAGWQAFLKILEDCPSKVCFIFCTTNPEKIPRTILSRSQSFIFTSIPDDLVYKRLSDVCEAEGITYDKNGDALLDIVHEANGCMREALVLLEKCVDYAGSYIDTNVTGLVLNRISNDSFYWLTTRLFYGEINHIYDYMTVIKQKAVVNWVKFLDDYIKYLMQVALHIDDFFVEGERYLTVYDVVGLIDCVLHTKELIRYSASPFMDIVASFIVFANAVREDK